MMRRYTKKLRQEIIRAFAIRHNGQYNPALFLDEVRETGPEHPAYEWFDWDDAAAAQQHRLQQARHFAQGLKVVFKIEEVGRSKAIKVREVEAPLVISSLDSRHKGGGYRLTDPENGDHMAEFCRQGAKELKAWIDRYKGAIAYAGGSTNSLHAVLEKLEAAASADGDKAA